MNEDSSRANLYTGPSPLGYVYIPIIWHQGQLAAPVWTNPFPCETEQLHP